MPGLTGGRIRKWLAVACIAAAAVLLLSCGLPYLAERFLLPALLPASVNTQYRISVYRLGPGGCTLKISGRPDAKPFIATGNIQMHWSLSGLRRRRLDRLVVDGLQVKIMDRTGNGEAGPSPFPSAFPKQNSSAAGADGYTLPLFIDAVQVVNSTVIYGGHSANLIIPVFLDGRRVADANPQNDKDILRYTFFLTLAEQELRGSLEFDQQVLSGTVRGNIDLHRLAATAGSFMIPAPEISGTADTIFSATARMAPFSLGHVRGEARLHNIVVRHGDIMIRGTDRDEARLSLDGSPEKFTVTAEGLAMEQPLQAGARLDAAMSFSDDTVHWQGNLHFNPAAGQVMPGEYILARTAPMEFAFTGDIRQDDLRWTVKTVPLKDEKAAQFAVERGGLRITAGAIGMESEWQYSLHNGNKQLAGDLLIQSGDLKINTSAVLLTLPRLQLGGKVVLEKGQASGPAFTGRIEATDASLQAKNRDVNLQGMRLQSPVSWPLADKEESGEFTVENMYLHNTALGTLKAKLSLQQDGMGFDGEVTSTLIPEGVISLNGSVHFPESMHSLADVTFSAADVPVAAENFSSVFPAAHTLAGSGLLNMEGGVSVHQDGIGGFLDIAIRDGNLEIPKIGIKAGGVNFRAAFPDLPALHTSPGQKVSIESITGKKLSVTGINSSYRLESPQSLFIEKISADWSGGRLMSGSLRLHKDKPGFDAILLCDRLDLAGVLTQLGLARAEGSGKVSGLIPVLYEKGNFYVDEGFLFSTPGETGTLKILQSEHLSAGLPEEVPHLSPIYFAGAALKDFQYKWAKLLISSEEEILRLKLQIDGRPAEKLPYRFDSRQNVFVRLAEGEAGGIDQPVKLDVNFNIPLNELLLYYKEMQPLLQNIR